MAKFLKTSEKRSLREAKRAAIEESMLLAVRETASVNAQKPRDPSAVSGSTRHQARQRTFDTSAKPAPASRLRCKATIKGQWVG